MRGCGLMDAWVKSDILGPSPRPSHGGNHKSYKRAMRAQKLILQALWRLFNPQLMDFITDRDSTFKVNH